jgi:hypothetical protein
VPFKRLREAMTLPCGPNRGCMAIPEEIRFWRNVQKGRPDECWPWTARRHLHGYGVAIVHEGVNRHRKVGAHRVAWRLTHGREPEGIICHHCDNPPCCNPAHLYEGSKLTNARDAVARGQQPRGEKHGMAKLTEKLVAEIRALYRPRTQVAGPTALARRFGLPVTTVQNVVYRKRWGHVR